MTQLQLVHPHYSTADISLAAYLHLEGYQLTHTDHSEFPTLFYFINTKELPHSVNLFECGKAVCNPRQYYYSYKLMIEKLKDNGTSKRGNR